MQNVFWKGFCKTNRNEGIFEIENIINRFGFITDFKMFSDLEISIKIEIEGSKIKGLYSQLKSVIEIEDYSFLDSYSTKERIIFLNITFLKGTGNLVVEGPIGPG